MRQLAVLAAGAMVSMPGWPGEAAAPLVDRLVDCRDIGRAEARLACFDREVAPLERAAGAMPPAAAAPSAAASSSAPEQPASTPPRSAAEQAVHARITGLRQSGAGTYVVTLDNGQSWRHENEHLGSYLREGDAVIISRGAVGSYRLTREAGKSKDWIRVTPVR